MHGVGFSEYSRVTNCHTQSPACLGIWPDHSRTPEATLGRLPAESATLHQVACGTLAGRHLQTPNLSAAESIKHAEQVGTVLSIRGHSAGSYAGMVWEGILAKFPNIEGTTVLAAIALPPSFLTQPTRSAQRQLHLIHHAWVCVWTPSKPDLHLLKQQGLKITLSASLVGEHTWAARSIIIHTGRRWNSLRDDMTLRPLNKYPVSCLVKYMHKAL